MNKEEITFRSSNGVDEIYGFIMQGENPKFILHIVHGVSEHILRYEHFANFICEKGGVVCGIDNLGHGRSSVKSGLGHFAKKDGDKFLVEDVYTLTTLIKSKYPNLPYVILGHSMGSFIVRSYLTKYGNMPNCVVLSGTAGTNKLSGVGKFLAKIACVFGGSHKQNMFLQNLAFGSYVKKFPESPFAWIAENTDAVLLYEKDKYCGFALTSQGFYDLATLLDSVSGKQWSDKIPKEIPYLLVSGTDDPVGDFGVGVKEVHDNMKNSGIKNVTMKLYDKMRHEILNERENQVVYNDIYDFISKQI